jgi:hypothetical protein
MRWIITLFGESIKGDENSEVMNVPNSMVGSIIGRGGETIQAIQRNSGCHVQVAREVSPLVSQLGFVSRSIGRSMRKLDKSFDRPSEVSFLASSFLFCLYYNQKSPRPTNSDPQLRATLHRAARRAR